MTEQKKLKILIVGYGQVGSMCSKIATMRIPHCEVVVTSHDRHTAKNTPDRWLDLLWGSQDVRKAVEKLAPDFIINCAAFNYVDMAEGEGKESAYGLNQRGAVRLAEAAKAVDALYIGFSTDYVFDGYEMLPVGHTEEAMANPLSVYGKSKLAGDKDVMEVLEDCPYYILRTSALWTDPVRDHTNFVKTVIEKMQHGDTMNVRVNQYMKPTHALDLAEAVMVLIGMYNRVNEIEYGLYNFANSGATSWFDFACAVAGHAFNKRIPGKILPVTAYPTQAQRPNASVLDCTKWVLATGLTPRHWAATLEHVGRFKAIPSDV